MLCVTATLLPGGTALASAPDAADADPGPDRSRVYATLSDDVDTAGGRDEACVCVCVCEP